MIAQDNIWRDMRRASRMIGALLLIVGGLVIAFQGFLVDMLPPADGFVRVDAEVITLEQRGTFREPAFSITLAYRATKPDGTIEEFRSGRRVEFEVFNTLLQGDTVTVDYNPKDPYEWRLTDDFSQDNLSDYALGLLMIVFGGFSLIFPAIIRLASREDDFSYQQETAVAERREHNLKHDKIAQG